MLATLLALNIAVVRQASPIDLKLAAYYFSEAKHIADEDKGELWGKHLYGPMLLVHGPTGTVVANEEPPEMGLQPQDGVFVGKLPKGMLVANTAVDWKGKKWSMVQWPLPNARVERARLMVHELWHRIQEEVGLPPGAARNIHLDKKDGRIWLQLEIRALRKTLLTEPKEMKPFIEDALVFRAYRQSLFPGSKVEEDRMEVHEGMAEFTGMMLRGTWQPETRYGLAYRMQWIALKKSLPSSFSYETGPAYGLLLNLQDKPWRPSLTPQSSLAGMVAELRQITLPPDIKAEALRRAQQYGAQELFATEEAREKERAAKESQYRKMLVDGPVLELPIGQMNFTYDPGNTFPLGDDGTVYPGTNISDTWGSLRADKAARITPDFKRVFVPAPAAGELRGDGWVLELKPGWSVVPGKRKGDFILVRKH